jgi:hypothetical protein
MPNPDDFQDITPAPKPTPKKKYVAHFDAIDWAVGQTFAQALGTVLPVGVRNKTLPVAAKITLHIDIDEA